MPRAHAETEAQNVEEDDDTNCKGQDRDYCFSYGSDILGLHSLMFHSLMLLFEVMLSDVAFKPFR